LETLESRRLVPAGLLSYRKWSWSDRKVHSGGTVMCPRECRGQTYYGPCGYHAKWWQCEFA